MGTDLELAWTYSSDERLRRQEAAQLHWFRKQLSEGRARTLLAVARKALEDAVGLEVTAINQEAARLAEAISDPDDLPWATDEPTPDLTHLWLTAKAHRVRRSDRPRDLQSDRQRYGYV
jgi:hypothetical protein